jgi:hypothetical protein
MRTSRGNIYHATVTETGHGLRAGERVAVYRDGMSWVVLADAGRVARLSTAEARGYLRTARIDGKPLEVCGTAVQFRRAALETRADRERVQKISA